MRSHFIRRWILIVNVNAICTMCSQVCFFLYVLSTLKLFRCVKSVHRKNVCINEFSGHRWLRFGLHHCEKMLNHNRIETSSNSDTFMQCLCALQKKNECDVNWLLLSASMVYIPIECFLKRIIKFHFGSFNPADLYLFNPPELARTFLACLISANDARMIFYRF